MALSAWIEEKRNTILKAIDINFVYQPTSPKEEDYRQSSPCGRTLCVQPLCVAFYCPELPTKRCLQCHQRIADNYGNLPGTF